MDDKEKLDKAISLLREWMYELAPLDFEDTSLGRDYQRLNNNTCYFLLNECNVDLENT